MTEYLHHFYQKYPKSTIEDFVKVFYQAMFGPEHYVKNPAVSLAMIREEMSGLTHNDYEDVYEYVGSEYVRINLRPYKNYGLNINLLNEFMIESSLDTKKNIIDDSEKQSFRQFLLEHFPENEVEQFLESYFNNPVPISHSSIYKKEYAPAYRIIHRKFLTEELRFYQINHYLDRLINQTIVFLAMDGKSCSGKTTLADLIERERPVTVIHTDDFFDNPDSEAIGINSRRIISEIFNEIKVGKPLTYRKYDCRTKSFRNVLIEKVHPLVLIEGVFSANLELINRYQGIIFAEVDDDTRMERLLIRSKPLISRFINEWIPREDRYFQNDRIRFRADLIV